MIHRQKRDAFSIELTAKFTVFYRRQRMGDHRHLQTMFGDVFRTHVTHQRPAVNQLHAGEMGEKWLCFIDYLLFSLRQTSLCGEADEDAIQATEVA